MLHLVSSIALAVGFATTDTTELRREELMTALRRGGYTVLLRHARTDRSFQEERSYVPKERNAQRNLTDDGIRDAALMGVVFRKYGIVFAEVISSPMFRTVETAEMAIGKPDTTMVLRTFPSTREQAALVAKAPKAGTNRLLVTHHFVIETHVPGISAGEIAESEAAVVRHTPDGKVELAGRITLDDWRALASPNPATTHAAPPATLAPAAHVGIQGASTSAQAAGTGATIPDTHAGHLAREYIAAFNTGDPQAMRAFIESTMLPSPERPTGQRLETYAKLFEQHGPLSVHMIEDSKSTEVTLGVRSKRGNGRLTLRSSDAQPMRVASVTFTFQQGAHP
jgi:phosphohistidine phosphatase SixA